MCCTSFLESLYRRGFEGKNLKLISTDGGPGLIAAVESVWPHKLRNVANKVKKCNERACLEADIDELLEFFSVPEYFQRKVRPPIL